MVMDTSTDTDVVKIFDFGFAKLLEKPGRQVQQLTQMGDVLGTPLYMSPEQSAGKPLDSRSDIYAVGCVMYEALTGRAPLIGENVLDTMQKQINEKPVALETVRPDLFIPEPMQAILFKTLEKNPDKRYQSMTDLKRDLDVLLTSMSGRMQTAGFVKQVDLPGLAKLKEMPEEKKGFDPVIPAVVLGLLVIGGFGWAMWQQSQSSVVVDPSMQMPPPQEVVVPPKPTVVKKLGQVPADPKRALPVLMGFAKEARDNGQLVDADKAVARAIQVLRSTGHTNDVPSAEAFSLAGLIALDLKDFRKADAMLQKALVIQQREIGPSSQEVIATLNALGHAAEGMQDFARSDAYYKQAMVLQGQ
jgi:predicted negative regulator of RcsB-dependent stress response